MLNATFLTTVCVNAVRGPGEDILAGIWVGTGAKLSNYHTFLCHSSHVSIRLDIPVTKQMSLMKIYLHKFDIYLRLSDILADVCDLSIAEIKLVHEGLAIEKMIERLRVHLKQTGTQTQETPFYKRGNAT